MIWHVLGVCAIRAFPKSTERYVFTYDRSMTLNGLVVLCCLNHIDVRFRNVFMHVFP
jgi:hypothetical protein